MTTTEPQPLLFVYGTLRRGSDHENAARLARESDWLGTARLTGTLYRVSWHPALVLERTDRVTGDLPPHDYRREMAMVSTASGEAQAMVYIWNLPLDGLERIASGDWLSA